MDKPTLIGKLEESLFNMGVAVENNEQRLYELEFMAADIKKEAVSDSGGAGLPKWEANFRIKLLSFVE